MIYFCGHHLFERGEIFSTYLIGTASAKFYNQELDHYYFDLRLRPEILPRIEFKILNQYLRQVYPTLNEWLTRSDIKYGGWFLQYGPGNTSKHDVPKMPLNSLDWYDVYLLLTPGSPEETALRFAWQVSNAEEMIRSNLDKARRTSAL